MKTGLIGYTGFVGSNLCEQKSFSEYFNSSNIEKIKNHEFDMLICAGLSGTKYKINKNPSSDLCNINNQKKLLKAIQVDKIIFISTIDVFDKKNTVNEKFEIDSRKLRMVFPHCPICVTLAFLSICIGCTRSYMFIFLFKECIKKRVKIEFKVIYT